MQQESAWSMAMPQTAANLLLGQFLGASRSVVLGITLALAVLSFYLDYLIVDVSLGVIYVLPMLPAALIMNRWQVLLFAVSLACVRIAFLTAESPADLILRFLLGLFAYCATGWFVTELVRNRLLILKHTAELEAQQNLRKEAEEHLNALAQSSPAAILTLGPDGRVMSGNRAAAELFGVQTEHLVGASIADRLPVLADALSMGADSPVFRTAAQCQGLRENGEVFVAQTWFSTYDTSHGRQLAAIAVDVSEEMCEREEENLRRLVANNRIVAAAVSHEIRNVCGAIAMVHSRLRTSQDTGNGEAFEAMGKLVEALSRIAAAQLQPSPGRAVGWLDLNEVLAHFRMIVEPDWRDCGAELEWKVAGPLPPVRGEPYGVLQALMNLSQNAQRAVHGSAAKTLDVAAEVTEASVSVSVGDSGPGVSNPGDLFVAFRSGSGETGLGLYVSRAILRSYGGDLRYVPNARGGHGACFVIDLARMGGR